MVLGTVAFSRPDKQPLESWKGRVARSDVFKRRPLVALLRKDYSKCKIRSGKQLGDFAYLLDSYFQPCAIRILRICNIQSRALTSSPLGCQIKN